MCTTEIGRLALKYKELSAKGVKLATLSCDPVTDHQKWLDDVVAHCENKVRVPLAALQLRSVLHEQMASLPHSGYSVHIYARTHVECQLNCIYCHDRACLPQA